MTEELKNDIEDNDNQQEDLISVDFLEKKQRELMTSTIDYNLIIND